MVIALIDEENVRRVVSTAEKSLKDCWAKLALLQSANGTPHEFLGAFVSFQPTLLATLVELESCYNEVCKCSRALVSKSKALTSELFSTEMEKLKQYKQLLREVVDVGKTLGDAFAWIFYQHNPSLLKKHYEHKFTPGLPTGTGGIGEAEFIRNHQRFGQYLVLAHSTTTFLREGDVSLIDPRNLKVVAIGELKTEKLSATHGATTIFLPGGAKLPANMLPKVSGNPLPSTPASKPLPSSIAARLKRQVQRIEAMFQQPPPRATPEQVGLTIGCSGLEELFANSSPACSGHVKVGRGLLLVGVKPGESCFASRLTEDSGEPIDRHSINIEEMRIAARGIVDPNLPDNGLIIGSMLYHAKERYRLGLRMRPVFWWPLRLEVREAITFRRMLVMTVYNPAFLINDLRGIGLEVHFGREGSIRISKKYGEGRLTFVGVDYLYEMIQTHLFAEESIVALVQRSIESVERSQIKRTTYVDLDFDFVFR